MNSINPAKYLNRLAFLVSALLIGFIVSFGLSAWHDARVEKVRELETMLELTEKGLDKYFMQSESALESLLVDIRSVDGFNDRAAARDRLKRFARLQRDPVAVSLVRLDGQVLATSASDDIDGLPSLKGDISFEEFVRSLARVKPSQTVDLSRPLNGLVSKRWIFPMRYIVREDGRPVAYLTSAVPVTLLQGFWSDSHAIERVSFGLVRDDGYLLSRYPVPGNRSNEELYGQQRTGTLINHLREASFPNKGFVQGDSLLSREPLTYAFKRLGHYPVTLFVALPVADFRSAWIERVRVPYVLVAALAALGLLGYRFVSARQMVWDRQRLQAERVLRESESEQRFLLDNIVAGVLIYGPDRIVAHCNPRAIQILGRHAQRLVGASMSTSGWTMLREDGGVTPVDQYPLDQVMATRAPMRGHIMGLVPPGSTSAIWLLTNVDPEFTSSGSLRRVVASFVDITTRKQVEQTLERSEAKFRLLFEHSLEGIVTGLPDGTIVSANPAACAILRMTEAQICAQGLFGAVDMDDPRLQDLLDKQTRDGHAMTGLTMIRGDGSRFEAEVSSSLYLDELGNNVCSIVIRDVTDKRRAEAAVAAQTAAENANRAKSRFLAHMSHELRTPLNAILGFSDVLQLDRRRPLDARQLEQVRHIHRAGEHLLAMINDLLDLSRVEAGVVRLSIANMDPWEIALQATRDLTLLAQAAEVAIVTRPPREPVGIVRGDAMRWRQIVVNLLSNAIKYNRPGGKASVEVAADTDRHKLVLVVRDTGLGMNAEQIERLFEPFDRLGREQSTIEGTGIGMVITKSLVDLMEGRLTVSSAVGAGAEFRVELPLVPAGENATADTRPADLFEQTHALTPARVAEQPSQPGDARCRVLYIDDDPINRMLVEALLELHAEVELSLASDGPEGLDIARSVQPHLILIDMLMPSMNGAEVLRAIRADESLAMIRCIAVSASAMPEEIERAMSAGFDGYLTKPLPASALMPEIDRMLAALRDIA